MPNDDPELEAIREKKRKQLKEQVQARTNMPTQPVKLTASNIDETVSAHNLVLLDLWAPWCGPCKQLAPVLESLAEELAGELVIGKVDVDEHPGVQQRFRVQGIPTLLLFKNGALIDRFVGALPKPQLQAKIEPHLS